MSRFARIPATLGLAQRGQASVTLQPDSGLFKVALASLISLINFC